MKEIHQGSLSDAVIVYPEICKWKFQIHFLNYQVLTETVESSVKRWNLD